MQPPIDLEAVLQNLRVYSDPMRFLSFLPPVRSIPDEDYFRNPAYQPLREGWAAGHLARALELQGHAVAVRLTGADQRFPDFNLTSDGVDYAFEFTEALPYGRRRGDEYREYAKAPTALRPYFSVAQAEGQAIIAEAIRRKAAKRYDGNPHLLVYADFSGEGVDLRKSLNLCTEACRSFASVWILMTLWAAKIFDSGTFPDAEMTAFRFQ